jgi:hypothetical protein
MKNTLLDLYPEFNKTSQKWEIRETDERGNALEVYTFDTEKEADDFVIDWVEERDNRSAGL